MEIEGWKAWIPGAGDKTVRSRLSELEDKAGTVPVLFALFLNEALKVNVSDWPIPGPVEVNYLLIAFILGCGYVYRDRKARYAKKAKDKAKEAATPNNQEKLNEYT